MATRTVSPDLAAEIRAEIAQTLGVPPDKLPGTLDPVQTGKILHIKPSTLQVWRSTGKYNLAFIKMGAKPYYRVADVVAFIARRRVTHLGEVA